jgi:hypothetical protein
LAFLSLSFGRALVVFLRLKGAVFEMAIVQPAKLDAARTIEYLQRKWLGNPCPMCRVSSWNVQGSVYQLLQFNPSALVVGGPVVPVIPVVCNNCGNTVLVNAITAGLLPPDAGGKS